MIGSVEEVRSSGRLVDLFGRQLDSSQQYERKGYRISQYTITEKTNDSFPVWVGRSPKIAVI